MIRAAKLIGGVRTALSLVENPHSLRALTTWPKFSATFYFMVSRFLRQGVAPRTVVDVGANTGEFAVASAKLFPGAQVYSFEPVPECVGELRENISGLDVAVYSIALGEEAGTLQFYVNSFNPSSSPLPLAETHRAAFPRAREERTIEVEVSTLDRVFKNIKLEPPVLLKLDVQGYEARVLRGGEQTLKRADYVVLEASFRPMYEGEPTFMEMA